MSLSKPNEYKEVSARQSGETIYAEDINQIISNIEKIKGGEADEAPVSNIKELKETLDNLGNGGSLENISADKVSFNNDNANLDFFSGYDFPKFKNKLKERYELKLITDYAVNSVSHIDEVNDIYTLILEKKNENNYILKGSLNYNKTSASDNLLFYIISIDGNNDFGHIISEMFQFINSENNTKENEIVIEGLNNFKYAFKFLYVIPIFQIKKQDNSNFEIKNYNAALNIEIPESNIKNNQEFIPIACGMSGLSFLKLKNINRKVIITGETTQTSANNDFILFSHFALENYFDIKTDKNDSYYIEAGEMIKSNKSKTVKYYIRKETIDGSSLNPQYANIPITCFYLEIKHTDDSKIEYNEILTFNLTAPKNADVPNIEKEANIQNAIEILNDKFNSLIILLGTANYNFEIASSILGSPINDNKIKDCSNLLLVKNTDNSYSLKGNVEIYEDAESSSIIFIKTTKEIETDIKNIIPTVMTDNLIIIPVVYENYLYINMQMIPKHSITNENFNNIKLIDNKIVLFNNELINKMFDTKVSKDFSIVYEDGKHKIKGQLIFASVGGESNFSFYTNSGIIDFFEDNKEYDISTNEGSLKAVYHHNNGFMSDLVFKGTAGTSYNIDWILPKQI